MADIHQELEANSPVQSSSMQRGMRHSPVLFMLAKRLGIGVLTLFVVSLVIFFGINLLPGDFASSMLGQGATPQAIEALRAKLGLDVPAPLRYWHWLTGMLHGDMGQSLVGNNAVSTLIGPRLFNTFFLASYAAVIAIPLAVFLGILAARFRGSLLDKLINFISLGAISFPEFFISYVLILFLAVRMDWFPSLAQVDASTSFVDRLYACFLPAVAMAMCTMAHMMRLTRAAILGQMKSSFIEMVRLKGISSWRVIVQHALRNALAPIINVIAINLAYLIVGVVLVEVVFAYPGLGQLLVDSVSTRDLPVVQAAAMIFGATYILLNLLADLLVILTNPRLLHKR